MYIFALAMYKYTINIITTFRVPQTETHNYTRTYRRWRPVMG